LPSLYLCQGSRWTFYAHFVVQCVKLMLRIFEFGVSLSILYIAKINSSEMFYQVWALRK